jgi:hypothetical protein
MRKYFHIFLGAVVVRNGLPSLQTWVSALIDWSLRSSATSTNVAFGDDVDMAASFDVSPFFLFSPSVTFFPIDTQSKELMVRY